MKKDERITQDMHLTRSIGYRVMWFGVFAILLFRWFYLGQTLGETLDLFLLWLFVSIMQFLLMAIKGISMTYPVRTTKKEQRWFMMIISLFTGGITGVLLWIIDGRVRTILLGMGFSALGTLFIFAMYYMLTEYFDRKVIEE